METKQASITLPHVNLNGTGANTLYSDYNNAREKIIDAIDAMRKIEFHSRDYMQQANGQEIWAKARAEHEARLSALIKIDNDLIEIQMYLADFIKS